MSNVVQAREAAIAAETQVERLFMAAIGRLHTYNNRLLALHDEIKQAQPRASGSVCLEIYPCGPGCSGCPHSRWVKYMWTEGTDTKPGILLSINLDAQSKDPILALARKEDHYVKTKSLIQEAKAILGQRSKLLARIKPLRYAPKER